MKNEKKSEIGARALGKNIRASAIKIRRITDRIRGCSYGEALVLPEFMPHKKCYLISQLILPAAANANTNFGLNKSDLFISEARVENSAYLKRFRPRAQGRGYPIKKPTRKVTTKSNSNFAGEIEG
uniref:Large ribosomal subunit protein uL22c n=1 Tax=Athyrium anisopterum TaxID=2023749 RepID=A0A222YUK3_9MONI|nr:ribosomal protein L22 [Athyrium anisopterum]YP_010886041.1 ribosomal protein L22 [Athyrium deltoidofrons]YP_010886308.1 ribosomal protein L22 [Athyrium reflexipinnum]YP_010886486.1 ribosomal protein L22 [Athyrium vidalii]ASR75012.1 ribosomal protein L22 [Athyrium anisopterum]WJH16244.1 ribosomal protein L22 [Athyrium deltoidofrons]WJH16511.1 ribosomal protein L22 [Athyrium reflexipinnum]WJH16689.1 ribosomal protein L22 [Athyrium vidalii]